MKPVPPIRDFVHAELRRSHDRMGFEVVLEAESLSGRKRPLRTGRKLLVNRASRSGGLAKSPAGPAEGGFNSREGIFCHVYRDVDVEFGVVWLLPSLVEQLVEGLTHANKVVDR